MTVPAKSRPMPLAGISFPVEELAEVRGWARAQGLVMEVVLDRVIDHAAYEEMLVICTPDRRTQRHVFWRTARAVMAQSPGERPRAFMSVGSALVALTPPPPAGRPWFRRGFLPGW